MTTILKHTFDRNMAQMQVNNYTIHQWNSYCKHYRILFRNIRSVVSGRHFQQKCRWKFYGLTFSKRKGNKLVIVQNELCPLNTNMSLEN